LLNCTEFKGKVGVTAVAFIVTSPVPLAPVELIVTFVPAIILVTPAVKPFIEDIVTCLVLLLSAQHLLELF
jgi:hypothetical protein